MLVISRYLFLAFQYMRDNLDTRICAQLDQLPPTLNPPYLLSVIAHSRTGNRIPSACETANNFPVQNWVLYRNGVAEDTTDSWVSPERYSNGTLTISFECDGQYSC